jgi:hypothetical protein
VYDTPVTPALPKNPPCRNPRGMGHVLLGEANSLPLETAM